jgi:NADPH:quinone reductase-like Zn-dependent oxidoreductase
MTPSFAELQVPESMKAAVIDRYGHPEDVMHVATVPVPELGDDEVLIRVGAAGIGAWDPDMCEGLFGDDGSRFPRVLGSDCAGTVVATGPEVLRFDVRDRVYAWGFLNPKGGMFAEYVAVPEEEVSPIPRGLSTDEAGVLAVDGLTALAGLDEVDAGPDQKLMIVGASGGVGHLAVQLAKRLGAHVLAVASGADGVELVRRLGADTCVDGRTADVAAAAYAFAPEGLDAALVVAPNAPLDALALVRKGGRIAYPNGVEPAPEELPDVTVEAYDGYSGHEALERLTELVEMAPFHVEVSREYSLDAASLALRDVTKHHVGKLALALGPR